MLSDLDAMLEVDTATLFLRQACHVFALTLHERFNYPIIVLEDTRAEQPKRGVHAYCLFSNWQSVDVVGIAREKDALTELRRNGLNYSRLKVSPNELRDYFPVRGGLYTDAELRVVRARAETQIDAYKDHYSGAIATAVPGLKRELVTSLEDLQDMYS